MFQKKPMITIKNNRRVLSFMITMFLFIGAMLTPVATAEASVLKVRYDGKTINFSGQQTTARLDGKTINNDKTPGLVIKSYSMVPYDTIFRKGLGAKCTYNSSKGILTIRKNDVTVQMTVDKTLAYVNGKKVTMPVAPTRVRYFAAGKTKIVVPAQFVATQLGYQYTWINNSKTALTIIMTSPFRIFYDSKWHNYNSSLGKVTMDGKNINVSDMPSLIINNTALVQAKAVFSSPAIGASYVYDKNAGTVTLTKDNNTIVITLGTKRATVNGQPRTMDEAARIIRNGKTKKSFIMVPARFVANSLGINYSWNNSTKTSILTTRIPEKQSGEYFNLNQLDNTPIIDPNLNYITNISAGYDATDKKDYITFTTLSPIIPTISDNNTTLQVTYPNTINTVGDQTQSIPNGLYLKSASVASTQDGQVVISLSKTSGSTYEVTQNGDQITIRFGGRRKIKIAVDAGHGANTPGKRTPKMPVDIDFEGDGIIDIKKGEQIREYIANLGVSKYLALELERCGFEVYRSAFEGEDIPLAQRQQNIKNAKCDYSISIHFNAFGDGKTFNNASGVEVFHFNTITEIGEGKEFAAALLRELIKGTPQVNRGVKGANLAMCRSNTMGTLASVLVECAFMTNEHEAINMMGNAAFWKETAQDIARGVCNYTGVRYIPE